MEYRVTQPSYKTVVEKEKKSILFRYPSLNDSTSCPYLVTLPPSTYIFECWGANGLKSYGGYTYGQITITEATTFYLYIGSQGKNKVLPHYNGGGVGDTQGGGASDIRLTNGEWDDFQSLKSRIMVAGGGGGTDCDGSGGNAGGINGSDGQSSYARGKGGTQTHGGKGYVNGSFGYGGSSVLYENNIRIDNGGGGGGGYYGGGTGLLAGKCSAGGGSSFISGHENCNAINESSTETNIIHTNSNRHYSGFVFFNTKMHSGGETMPLPSGLNSIGHEGDGAIRISSTTQLLYKTCTMNMKHGLYHFNSRLYCTLLLSLVST